MLNFPVLLYSMFLFGTTSIQYNVPKFGIPNYLEKIKLVYKSFLKEKSGDSFSSFSCLRAHHFIGQDWKWHFFFIKKKSL